MPVLLGRELGLVVLDGFDIAWASGPLVMLERGIFPQGSTVANVSKVAGDTVP